jgi:succinate dehydrogenase / fumarate reductase cytochrome b subunit
MNSITAGTSKRRPEYRNIHALTDLTTYRLPAAGWISILHRISGTGLFLALPFLLFMFDRSLTSELSYSKFKALADLWFVKLLLIGLSWAYLHHFCAGIRHLFMDMHMGLDKAQAKTSAIGVFVVSLTLELAVALKILGVF